MAKLRDECAWIRAKATLHYPTQMAWPPRANDWCIINGIFWVLRSDARWKDLPQEIWSPVHLPSPLSSNLAANRLCPKIAACKTLS